MAKVHAPTGAALSAAIAEELKDVSCQSPIFFLYDDIACSDHVESSAFSVFLGDAFLIWWKT